ncbi:hypothetical protein GCU60_17695 [Blastococcus saxobsidens]|uniref:Uncharacterized protein n=1 Tax=Blastococcus saxobsidens TaxID=138336 RepID=A0A6L9W679_9ACTN|nr:hypothetical protein [Blastococcus saxobsidens]
MSALPAGDAGAQTMIPHWLDATARERLAGTVRAALDEPSVHPVTTIHLHDVLTELHVATAREAIWPASTARVRLATGWDEDVLPVRLSSDELSAVLSLPGLPESVRVLLGDRDRRA